jgi:hypothetical protein
MPRCEVQTNFGKQLSYPPTDLDEQKPQSVELHLPYSVLKQLPSQSVQQPVGCSMQ